MGGSDFGGREENNVLNKTILFEIQPNNDKAKFCKAEQNVSLHSDGYVELRFRGVKMLKDLRCKKQKSNNDFLTQDVLQREPNVQSPTVTVFKKVTKSMNGKWMCKFLSFEDDNQINPALDKRTVDGHNYTEITCTTEVYFNGTTTDHEEGTPMWLIACGVGGGVVLLIIIAQTAVIIHFRKKAKKAAIHERLEGSTRSRSADDTARYSSMPGEKQKKKKGRESVIYESLENLRMKAIEPPTVAAPPCSTIDRKKYKDISQRPQQPLPVEDDNIYEGNDSDQEMTPPHLMNRKYTQGSGAPPKPTKPNKRKGNTFFSKFHQREEPPEPEPIEYDYTDNTVFTLPKNIDNLGSLQRPPKPTPQQPARKLATPAQAPFLGQPPRKYSPSGKPPPQAKPSSALQTAGGPQIKNELDNIFQKRRGTASSSRQLSEPQTKPEPPTKPVQPPKPTKSKHIKPGVQTSPMRSPGVIKKPLPPPPSEELPRTVHKPVPPAPTKKPPIPIPVTEETYEAVHSDNSEDEWTYEPLPEYPIYSL